MIAVASQPLTSSSMSTKFWPNLSAYSVHDEQNDEFFDPGFFLPIPPSGDHLGHPVGIPLVEALSLAIPCVIIMLFTIIGNTMVIIAIFTYRPLKNVQNMYLVSLAVADITVAMFVMPFNVIYTIRNRWDFGLVTCKVWLTCDILCCTASILNLCAIAIDRYQAIHDPINYAQKRTLRRVLIGVGLVWLISALISIPPLLGWNDWPETFNPTTPCTLTSERGFVIYSSSGSFFIPLIIMSIVYVKIYVATRRRLRARSKAAASKVTNFRSNVHVVRDSLLEHSRLDDIEEIPIDLDSQGSRTSSKKFSSKKEKKIVDTNFGGTQMSEPEMTMTSTSPTTSPTEPANKEVNRSVRIAVEETSQDEVPLDVTSSQPEVTSSQPEVVDVGRTSRGRLSQRRSSHEENNKEVVEGKTREDEEDDDDDKKTSRMDVQRLSVPSSRFPSVRTSSSNDEDHVKKSMKFAVELESSSYGSNQGPSTATATGATSVLTQVWEEKQRISLSRERKAARVLGIVMGVFVACWLPFFLMYVIMPFAEQDIPRWLENVITWLGYVNSALNPIIYTIFNLDFRKAFQRLVSCQSSHRH